MSDNGRAPVRLLLTVEEAAEALTISGGRSSS